MMIEGVAGHIIAQLVDHVLHERLWKIRLLPCKFIGRSDPMRVSFSALLRLAEGDSYLLVRNLHRKESFGPLGGVYKHHASARSKLDDLEFRPQGATPLDDMKNDLRGFLPRRRLPALVKRFDDAVGREDDAACLHRELVEELKEVRLTRRLTVPRIVQFKHVRRVQEGPARAVGQSYKQYRTFDIYDIAEPDREVIQFLTNLRVAAATHKVLMLASAREIVVGRSDDGRTIAHHAGYLFGRKRVRPDAPMFVEAGGTSD